MKTRVAAIIIDAGKVLLLGRRKAGRRYHCLPGGGMEPGETPQEACVREVREETCLAVEIGPLVDSFENQGRMESYFLARAFRGQARLGGPELRRHSPQDSYALEWVGAEELKGLDLLPRRILATCQRLLREEADPGEPLEPTPAPAEAEGLEVVETPAEAEEDGLEHLRIEIRKALPGRRLDKYLSGRLGKQLSRTALQGYIREGSVTVGGRAVKPSHILRAGDTIDLLLPPARPKEIPPEPIPLDVIWEDDDVLAVNKQAGLIVHPARGNWTGTLVNALAYYFRKDWRDIRELPSSGEVFRPGIVHRLDRDTTGVILIAKTELALWRLGRQFELRQVRKTYTAIVHGLVSHDEDVIDVPIGKHPKVREKYAVHRRTGLPYPVTLKEAVTRYKVVERIGPVGRSRACFSLVELYPQTGRTHQLRVHMSYIGHPIVGDKMYGGGPVYRSQLLGRAEEAVGPLITRQALHAHTIRFRHPRTGKEMELTAPWPPDFTQTWKELQSLAAAV